jgi:FlaG/FlaF family flagellin (archaellin)
MQHRDIPDGQRHEPKGISTASEGDVYVANGNGSGEWKAMDAPIYGQGYISALDVNVGTANTFYDIGSFNNVEQEGVLVNSLDGTLTVQEAGTYRFVINAICSTTGTQDVDITYRYLYNNVAQSRTLTVTSTDNGQKIHAGASTFLEINEGGVLKLQLTSSLSRVVTIRDLDVSLFKIK